MQRPWGHTGSHAGQDSTEPVQGALRRAEYPHPVDQQASRAALPLSNGPALRCMFLRFNLLGRSSCLSGWSRRDDSHSGLGWEQASGGL